VGEFEQGRIRDDLRETPFSSSYPLFSSSSFCFPHQDLKVNANKG
jgi:hypothetical protein